MPNIRMPNMERVIIVLPAPPRLRACPALIVRGRAQYPPHQAATVATPQVGRSTPAGHPAARTQFPPRLLAPYCPARTPRDADARRPQPPSCASRPVAQPPASLPHMLLDKFFYNLGQVWVANFFQLILDAARGMRKRDQARKIDRGRDHDRVARHRRDRSGEILELRGRVAHCRERMGDPGPMLKG